MIQQRRRFFPAREAQILPGRRVEVGVQVSKASPSQASTSGRSGLVVDADYLVIRYVFAEPDGSDLDTRTRIFSPVLAPPDFMGWSRKAFVARPGGVRGSIYAQWGGDNTGHGVESVLVDVREVAAEFPTAVLSIETRAFWYEQRLAGNCLLTVDVYKGGVMALADYEFSCVGGELVASLDKTVGVSTVSQSNVDGDFLTFVCYDIPSRRISFECSPEEPGIPIEGETGECGVDPEPA